MRNNRYLEKIAEKSSFVETVTEYIPETVSTGAGALVGGKLVSEGVGYAGRIPQFISSYRATQLLRANKGQADLSTIKSFIRDANLSVEFVGHPKLEKLLNNGKLSTVSLEALRNGKVSSFAKNLDEEVVKWRVEPSHFSKRKMDRIYLDSTPHTRTTGRKVIRINRDALMHELGHVKDMQGRKGKIKLGAQGVSTLSMGVPLLMYANEDTRQYSTAVMAALQASLLRNEYVANKHAYESVKVSKGKAAAKLSLRRSFGPAYTSYLVGAAAKVLATEVGRRAANRASNLIKEKGYNE